MTERRANRQTHFWMSAIVALGLIIIVSQEYVRPWAIEKLYEDEYKRLTFACDMAMHEEAALRQMMDDTEAARHILLSADVAMMVCHDYDKLRKKMLINGISEDQLAMLGLQVLEVEQITVSQMVDAHRMDRF